MIYENYHKITTYLLFPLKSIIGFLTILSVGVFIWIDQLMNTNYSEKITIYGVDFFSYIINLKINIIKDINYINLQTLNEEGKGYILVYNHIHIYDHLCTINLQNKLMSYVMNEGYNIFPLTLISKVGKFILCNQHKEKGSVKKIINHVKNNKIVSIAPDACNIIPDGKLIAPFKNGAFIPKEKIIPVVIRYVPSRINNINWDNDHNILSILVSGLIDGHICVYMKVLKEENWDENYKSHEDYRDVVYDKMVEGLKTLPE